MKILYISGILTIVFILLIIIYLIFFKKNTIENSNTFKIIQKTVKSFNLDEYTVYKNKDILLKSGGTWSLDKKNLYITIDKTKININIHGNEYHFTHKHDATISGNEIIIDNYADVIQIKKIKDGYQFVRKNKVLAEIVFYEKDDGNNVFHLDIKENEDYLYIYIIAFIIFEQINKDINMSLD